MYKKIDVGFKVLDGENFTSKTDFTFLGVGWVGVFDQFLHKLLFKHISILKVLHNSKTPKVLM